MDLFSDWLDGVSGSLTVHLQNLHITVANVDFSGDIDDASFFEGLFARMFHLLGFCLSGLLSLSTYLLLMKCALGLRVVMLAFLLAYVLQSWSFLGNVWSPDAKNFFACLGRLSPLMHGLLHAGRVIWFIRYVLCLLCMSSFLKGASTCCRHTALLGLCLSG
ncbi:hypothetical protein NC651_006954 [Populus alba x Populus x berolinensis]|nr:hypothetical protein NC651_006954 [Populus alba x Populus x berolinensis]